MGLALPAGAIKNWTPADTMVHDLCKLATIWSTTGDAERLEIAVELMASLLGEASAGKEPRRY